MRILWTDEAERTYRNNIEYLIEEWDSSVIADFIHETELVLKLLSSQPHMGRYDNFFGCNRILVVKQISLLYDIDDDNDCIILKSFWDNRQKPIRRLF